MPSEMERLRQLGEENTRLKKIVEDLSVEEMTPHLRFKDVPLLS